MLNIQVLFGTESGTAEFVAGDIENKLRKTRNTSVYDLAEFDLSAFSKDTLYVIVCSTYGEGDPPSSARPFLTRLENESPNLEGIRFAIFGLGDSSYSETFNHGSNVISEALEKFGAVRVGEFGRHDASGREHASDVALDWLDRIIPHAVAISC
jgi:MioC protein